MTSARSNLLRLVRRGRVLRLKAPAGTFSYYHPQMVFTGFGWDTQSASLALLKRRITSILILGLGGGTVARQCRALFPDAKIVGIEMDKGVLDLAYRFFDITALNIVTVNASGADYLRAARSRFDAILDDQWPADPQSAKPILSEAGWVDLVGSRLRVNGLYAVNLYSRQEAPREVSTAVARLSARFPDLCEVRPRWGQTTVIAAGQNLHSPHEADARLKQISRHWSRELAGLKFSTIVTRNRRAN